jgi:hypothetical protein
MGAGPVLAEDEDFARNGLYAGINMVGTVYTKIEDDAKTGIERGLEGLTYSGDTDTESPLGIGATVGYRFHPHLAAEIRFDWFTNSVTDFNGWLAAVDGVPIPDDDKEETNFDILKVETLNLTGNLKGYLLTGRIQPFVQAGGGLMHANAKDKFNLGVVKNGDAFAARFGGGVDLYLNPHFFFVVEGGYVLPTGKLDELKSYLWSVGINYRF